MLRSNSRILCLAGVTLLLLVAPKCWAQQSTVSTKTSEKSNGAITGRLVSASGEPLPGAMVYAGSLAATTRSHTATADDNGDFRIDGLDAGLYRVSASAPGYVPASQPSLTDSQGYYHIGDSVILTMVKGGVITGTVTGPKGPAIALGVHAIRVRDEAGKPLSAPVLFRERSTDDRGVYRFYGLLPGAYLVAAAKPQIGFIAPSAYDNDAPTYFPSSTRDTASEIVVRSGEEITADIQYRAEAGHAISGKVAGVAESQTQFSSGASITLVDVRDRSAFMSVAANSNANFGFAFYGIPDGEYELYASQYLPSRDELRSPPRRVTVRGEDVTGINLTLGSQASIEGRLVFERDPKADCAERREAATQETIVFGRRYEPEKKIDSATKAGPLPDVSLSSINYVAQGVADAKGTFTLRNLPSGTYLIDPRAPASGWYLRSITSGAAQTAAARNSNPPPVAREGLTLKTGERVSGLTVTFTEGAASVRGRVSGVEGQNLPPRLRVYLVPAERESIDNVLRFFEGAADGDGRFSIGNLAPGRYWIIARQAEENDSTRLKLIRQDSGFRARVLHESESLKKEISFKPCERTADYDLPYGPTPTARQ
jgi:hypothetical protein